VILPKGLTGLQLWQQARARRPGLKVLFMSGYAANAVQRSGVFDLDAQILSKPFRKADLARMLRLVLDGGDGA